MNEVEVLCSNTRASPRIFRLTLSENLLLYSFLIIDDRNCTSTPMMMITLLGIIMTGIKWRVLGDFAIFSPFFILTSHNKYRPLSSWGSQGVWVLILSYHNRCLTFTREDYWSKQQSLSEFIVLILYKIFNFGFFNLLDTSHFL